MENLITKNVVEGLKTTSPRTPRFYIQPKIYEQGNPGRPAISSVNCHTSSISKYVDYHLQPIAQQIPSYIKNKSDFLRKVNKKETVPDNSYLVSLDVRSLYTNIANCESIKAVKTSLRELSKNFHSSYRNTHYFSIINLTLYLLFNYENYSQIKGCVMRTICAPVYANIFMDDFERNYIYLF